MEKKYDVIIVGTGVAGLNAALHLPADKKVLVICKGTPDKSDSYLAQGGICRLQGEEDYESYVEDTMRAGHGENNPAAVECMIRGSEKVTDGLVELGVEFARTPDASVRVVASDDAKGTLRILASVLASKVFPQPVGPKSRILLFSISTSPSVCPAAMLLMRL